MDEGTLNDLLECSVCLDRLDTSSKVLPCQHTFCRKCLEEIVKKHKELRCPECRILVNLKIEELPPNVLLMRILEGIKNSGPKKPQRINRPVQPVVALNHVTQTGTPEHRIAAVKQSNITGHVPHQPYAKALYDFVSKEVGDLNFKRGDIIILKKRIDSHWFQGECGGRQGFFPLSYVQVITPVPSHIPQCKALYDFRMTNDEDEGCLTFKKSDIINVIRRVDENWAEGKLNGKIGIFPLAFVELNSLARSLMKLSTNAQPGPSRVAPPTPTTEDSTPLIPTDHTRSLVNSQRSNQARETPQTGVVSDSTVSSGSSSTTTPNVSSSNTSSSSSTAPSSPASPPPRTPQAVPPRTAQKPDIISSTCGTPQRAVATANTLSPSLADPHRSREKRHSFTGILPSTPESNSNRHSAEILTSESVHSSPLPHAHGPERPKKPTVSPCNPHEVALPAAYIALYPYKPQKSDELELKKGAIYMVTERCQDGWFKGTSNRTQKCGVFPGNYVQLARGAPNASSTTSRDSPSTDTKVSHSRGSKSVSHRHLSNLPPELPPRATSPCAAISSSWHGQQEGGGTPLGRSSSAIMSSSSNAITQSGVSPPSVANCKADKSKDRKDKGVSLMRRLTSIKRSKSPPASTYSMDNPVFEDASAIGTSTSTSSNHPVHVRSGSCPSQLLQTQPSDYRTFGSNSQRIKHKDRPSILPHNTRNVDQTAGSSNSSPDVHHHRKSNSLDGGNHRQKTGVQTVRERFRCIAPYPPNSEYELELQVHDIIYVHKKRDDGWYKGTQQRTGKTGLFPASFVESF